jgi:hypothetical protein
MKVASTGMDALEKGIDSHENYAFIPFQISKSGICGKAGRELGLDGHPPSCALIEMEEVGRSPERSR